MPVGQNRTYTCTAHVGAPVWSVNFSDNASALVIPRTNEYNQRGIFVPKIGPGEISSTLTITGMVSNNNTKIQCVQHLSQFDFRNTTEILTFQVYSKRFMIVLSVAMCSYFF